MLTRALAVFYIMTCFTMGLVLLCAPWLSSWTGNFFAYHYLWIDGLVRNYYVRGGISGVGLADIGLGAYEARRFRRYSRTIAPALGEPQVPR